MASIASLAGIASLIGEPSRTAMLLALMDGRALTAGELAAAAGIGPSAASEHLARLFEGGLLALERQGRHRYYRLSGPAVAGTLEGLMALDAATADIAAAPRKAITTGPRNQALRRARTCYNHLAGEIAVAIAQSMVTRGQLDFSEDGASITDRGQALLASMEVDIGQQRPPFSTAARYCGRCLDWSERKPHIGGAVGAAMYRTFLERDWMRSTTGSRAVLVTPLGMGQLGRYFDLPDARGPGSAAGEWP